MRTFIRDSSEPRHERQPKPGEQVNRWSIPEVICLDCGSAFGIDDSCIERDLNRKPGDGNRVLLVWLPGKCPDCHNLKAVPKEVD